MAENAAASRHTELRPLSEVNREPGGQTISTVVRILNAIMRPLTKRDWRYQDKVPQTGGVIFVANHISNADPLAVGQFLAYSGRWPRFLAKASVFEIPVVGRIIAACGQIRFGASPHIQGRAHCRRRSDRARPRARDLPRGNDHPRSRPVADAGQDRSCAASIYDRLPGGAHRAVGCPGADARPQAELPRLLPRKTLRVAVGDPVPLDDLREKPVTVATLDEATTRIMDAIAVLVAELRAATPPAHRYDPDRENTTGDHV